MTITFGGGKTAAEIEAQLPSCTPEEEAFRQHALAISQFLTPENFIFLPPSRQKRCTPAQLDGILDPEAELMFARKLLTLVLAAKDEGSTCVVSVEISPMGENDM
ncbi:MAG: hypothetical protein K8L97_33610 [Anaerolineae bacterium]|nr:hypothetical protein [Anaerolineae bacterium]